MSPRHTAVTDQAVVEQTDDVDWTECPIVEILSLIGDKWSVQVLQALSSGPLRFTQLERAVPRISRRMLTVSLRNLERNGLVTRTIYPEVPPRVVYARTPLTDDLARPLNALCVWAEAHRSDVIAARLDYDLRSTQSAGEQ